MKTITSLTQSVPLLGEKKVQRTEPPRDSTVPAGPVTALYSIWLCSTQMPDKFWMPHVDALQIRMESHFYSGEGRGLYTL